jgi:hypothetical protein
MHWNFLPTCWAGYELRLSTVRGPWLSESLPLHWSHSSFTFPVSGGSACRIFAPHYLPATPDHLFKALLVWTLSMCWTAIDSGSFFGSHPLLLRRLARSTQIRTHSDYPCPGSVAHHTLTTSIVLASMKRQSPTCPTRQRSCLIALHLEMAPTRIFDFCVKIASNATRFALSEHPF